MFTTCSQSQLVDSFFIEKVLAEGKRSTCLLHVSGHIDLNDVRRLKSIADEFSTTKSKKNHPLDETVGRFLDCKVEQIRHSPNIFARICGKKVGHRRTAKFDRAISMNCAQRKPYKKSTPLLRHCVRASTVRP